MYMKFRRLDHQNDRHDNRITLTFQLPFYALKCEKKTDNNSPAAEDEQHFSLYFRGNSITFKA